MTERVEKIKRIDNYQIEKTIGEGTFGKVKLGIHIPTGEKVAIKVLEKDKIQDNEDSDRIAREIRFLKALNHPNVIRILQIVEDYKNYYIIMEFAKCGELFNYIVRHKRLSEEEAAIFYVQLLHALGFIHQHGIVHRDIKPENILLKENFVLTIIDFGLSNHYKKGQLLSTPCGSPCYAAPEMILNKKYNGLMVDLWSSGIVLYAMVCGYLPFEDKNNDKLYQKILIGKFEMPERLSDSCKDLIKRILTVNPKKRIKFEEVMNHPFLKKGQEWYKEKFGHMKDTREINYSIVDKMVLEMNYDGDAVIRNLQLNRHNNLTTTYYLLWNKEGITDDTGLHAQEDSKPQEEPKPPEPQKEEEQEQESEEENNTIIENTSKNTNGTEVNSNSNNTNNNNTNNTIIENHTISNESHEGQSKDKVGVAEEEKICDQINHESVPEKVNHDKNPKKEQNPAEGVELNPDEDYEYVDLDQNERERDEIYKEATKLFTTTPNPKKVSTKSSKYLYEPSQTNPNSHTKNAEPKHHEVRRARRFQTTKKSYQKRDYSVATPSNLAPSHYPKYSNLYQDSNRSREPSLDVSSIIQKDNLSSSLAVNTAMLVTPLNRKILQKFPNKNRNKNNSIINKTVSGSSTPKSSSTNLHNGKIETSSTYDSNMFVKSFELSKQRRYHISSHNVNNTSINRVVYIPSNTINLMDDCDIHRRSVQLQKSKSNQKKNKNSTSKKKINSVSSHKNTYSFGVMKGKRSKNLSLSSNKDFSPGSQSSKNKNITVIKTSTPASSGNNFYNSSPMAKERPNSNKKANNKTVSKISKDQPNSARMAAATTKKPKNKVVHKKPAVIDIDITSSNGVANVTVQNNGNANSVNNTTNNISAHNSSLVASTQDNNNNTNTISNNTTPIIQNTPPSTKINVTKQERTSSKSKKEINGTASNSNNNSSTKNNHKYMNNNQNNNNQASKRGGNFQVHGFVDLSNHSNNSKALTAKKKSVQSNNAILKRNTKKSKRNINANTTTFSSSSSKRKMSSSSLNSLNSINSANANTNTNFNINELEEKETHTKHTSSNSFALCTTTSSQEEVVEKLQLLCKEKEYELSVSSNSKFVCSKGGSSICIEISKVGKNNVLKLYYIEGDEAETNSVIKEIIIHIGF